MAFRQVLARILSLQQAACEWGLAQCWDLTFEISGLQVQSRWGRQQAALSKISIRVALPHWAWAPGRPILLLCHSPQLKLTQPRIRTRCAAQGSIQVCRQLVVWQAKRRISLGTSTIPGRGSRQGCSAAEAESCGPAPGSVIMQQVKGIEAVMLSTYV